MNNFPNIWTVSPELTVKGPVKKSHRFNQQFGTYMDYFECEVANKAKLPPTRFGAVAQIVGNNSNKATLTAWTAPGFFEGDPEFTTLTRRVFNLSEFIQEADVIDVVIEADDVLITDEDTWEASKSPIDEVHSMSQKVQVVTTNTVVSGTVDPQLNVVHRVERSLVKASVAEVDSSFPAALLSGAGTFPSPATHRWTTYEEVRYGWYIKTVEGMSNADAVTYGTTRSRFWPAVMETFTIDDVNGIREDGEEYIAKVVVDCNYKEAYNGQSRAEVLRGWANAVPPSVAPSVILTDQFTYSGIYFNWSSKECLHSTVDITESTGNHPDFARYYTRDVSFEGTDQTDWPDYQVYEEDPVPYKGGWLKEIVKVYKPVDTERSS